MAEQLVIDGVDIMELESEEALDMLMEKIEGIEYEHVINGEEDTRFENLVQMVRAVITVADPDDDQEMGYVLEALSVLLNFEDDNSGGNACDISVRKKEEALQVLDYAAEKGISFTELRYYRGDRTNLRDYLIDDVFDLCSLLEKLYQMGVDLNEALIDGMTPVHRLAARDRAGSPFRSDPEEQKLAEVMKYFSVESMEALNKEGTSAVHTAVRENHFEMVEAMIGRGVDLNITEDQPSLAGTTPLHTACECGRPGIVSMLLEAGADDTAKNVNEETPAHIAVSDKMCFHKTAQEERVEILNALKNIDIPGKDGRTPLMLAQDYQLNMSDELSAVLIKKGADVNKRDNDGNNAMMLYARWRCHMSVVKMMVKAGLDLNARNKEGDTILHLAMRDGRCEAARYLIKKGADYNLANEEQVTPLQIAVEKGLDDVLVMMV